MRERGEKSGHYRKHDGCFECEFHGFLPVTRSERIALHSELRTRSARCGSRWLHDPISGLRLRDRSFRERFGVRVCTAYNMTELSCPIVSGWLGDHDGSSGRLRPGWQARIVNEHD